MEYSVLSLNDMIDISPRNQLSVVIKDATYPDLIKKKHKEKPQVNQVPMRKIRQQIPWLINQ